MQEERGNKKMLIVTGMDNTGKTTLVKQLLDEFNSPDSKNTEGDFKVINSPGPIGKEAQERWLISQLTLRKEDRDRGIYERFPILEEMVYGPVLRGQSLFEHGDPYFKLLKELNPMIIYTRPSRDKIFNFGDRYQMEGVIEKGTELLAAYDDLMLRLMGEGWKVIVYDYETGEPKSLAGLYQYSEVLEELRTSL